MWCLTISISYPDPENPGFESDVYFYETKQEALHRSRIHR